VRSWWRLICVIGVIVQPALGYAGPRSVDVLSGAPGSAASAFSSRDDALSGPAIASSSRRTDSTGGDAVASPGGVCVPVADNMGARAGPFRAGRTGWIHIGVANINPFFTPTPKPPAAVTKPSREHEPAGHGIAMTNGAATFNILTTGAERNSSITLRIDNRTRVTITVDPDAAAASCPAVLPPSSHAQGTQAGQETHSGQGTQAGIDSRATAESAPGSELVTASKPAAVALCSPVVLMPQWQPRWPSSFNPASTSDQPTAAVFASTRGPALGSSFPILTFTNTGSVGISDGDAPDGASPGRSVVRPKDADPGDGNGGGTVAQTTRSQPAVLEPSTLVLLGSGLLSLRLLARRRR
jgi:hypothetical protein